MKLLALVLAPLINLLKIIRNLPAFWELIFHSQKDWPYINHFSTKSAFVNFFYQRRLWEMQHPRDATDRLSNYHFTKLSLTLYCKAGALTLLISGIVWTGSHFIWFDSSDKSALYIAAIIFLAAFSTTFTRQVFHSQNYNVLGWALAPLVCFGWLTGDFWTAIAALTVISFLSFTATIFFVFAGVVLAVASLTPMYLISVGLPAIKLAFHALPLYLEGQLLARLQNTLSAIGTGQSAKYKRDRRNIASFTSFSLRYRLATYIIFALVLTADLDTTPSLLLISYFIWALNIVAFRFADPESTEVFVLTAATAELLSASNVSFLSVAGFILLSNQLNESLSLRGYINLKRVYQAVSQFLASAPRNVDVLMGLTDPQGKYDDLFPYGQKMLIDLLGYNLLKERGARILPDYDFVFENNKPGGLTLWGRDYESIKLNLTQSNATHFLICEAVTLPIDATIKQKCRLITSLDVFEILDDRMVVDLKFTPPFLIHLYTLPRLADLNQA